MVGGGGHGGHGGHGGNYVSFGGGGGYGTFSVGSDFNDSKMTKELIAVGTTLCGVFIILITIALLAAYNASKTIWISVMIPLSLCYLIIAVILLCIIAYKKRNPLSRSEQMCVR